MKKNLALAAIALVFLLGAAFQSSNSIPGQLNAIQAELSDLKAQVTSLANKGPRTFYLTKTGHTGAEALSACAAGYHMASMWEILDPTNLRYNTELGQVFVDSGSGPPAEARGWIRNGGFPRGDRDDAAGNSNCNAWTSGSVTNFGTTVRLPLEWLFPGTTAVGPWIPAGLACSQPDPVWCVQD